MSVPSTWIPPKHDAQRELRDHLSVEGWRQAIDAICARHDLDSSSASPFPTGSDIVWSVGAHVVKMSAPRWKNEIEAERSILEHVSGRLRVRTPEVLAIGEIEDWPYVVMTHVPGIAIGDAWAKCDRVERLRLASTLGEMTRELHALPLPPGADGWAEFTKECTETMPKRHRQESVPMQLRDEVEACLAPIGDTLSWPRALLHTELLHQHVLVEEQNGHFEPCALIDFADGRVGPVEYEFPAPVEFLFKGEPGMLRAFLSAYGYESCALNRELSERLLAWGLFHRFGRLSRMLACVAPDRPVSLKDLAVSLYDVTS